MRCPTCNCDLGTKTLVVAINSTIVCSTCAAQIYTPEYLETYGEEVIPSDIGIEPERTK